MSEGNSISPSNGVRIFLWTFVLPPRDPLRSLHVQQEGHAHTDSKGSRLGVPLTNYGLTIAYSLGIFERALGPFPEALAVFQERQLTALSRERLVSLLETRDAATLEDIRRQAEELTLATLGNKVYYRGLVEFSNICSLNCRYCGIRRDNAMQRRYMATISEIVEAAEWCARAGFGSMVLQSGERRDAPFVDFVEEAVRSIKARTVSPGLPKGIGITLCVGEQYPRDVPAVQGCGRAPLPPPDRNDQPGPFRQDSSAGAVTGRQARLPQAPSGGGFRSGHRGDGGPSRPDRLHAC